MSSPTRSAGSSGTSRCPRSSPARTSSSKSSASGELARALLAAGLEVGPLLLAQLGGRGIGEPPLAADPVPVASCLELAEHGEQARLHPPPHQLVGGHVLATHEVEE